MPTLPPGLFDCVRDVRKSLRGVEGYLSDREAQFLTMLAACPTCDGEIVEIGSYCGRSAIPLAKGAALSDSATVHTVDILLQAKLEENLQRADVRNRIAVYNMPSQQMLTGWRQQVRLFWHDGGNDYATVARDLELIQPFLSDRAVIAFHDVLNTSGVRIKVFAEKVLASAHFGAVGVCGSIGWAQFRANPAHAQAFDRRKQSLRTKLHRLYPFYDDCMGRRVPWAERAQYKLLRTLIPHGRMNPRKWSRRVA